MGMYTSLEFHGILQNLSKKEVDAIKWIYTFDEEFKPILPKHEFFTKMRANMIFTCNDYMKPRFVKKDENFYVLETHAEIKNYEGEIELFLDWIKPFVFNGLLEDEAYAQTQYEEYEDYCYYYLDRVENKQTYDSGQSRYW
jgi:hypothetical protein